MFTPPLNRRTNHQCKLLKCKVFISNCSTHCEHRLYECPKISWVTDKIFIYNQCLSFILASTHSSSVRFTVEANPTNITGGPMASSQLLSIQVEVPSLCICKSL